MIYFALEKVNLPT